MTTPLRKLRVSDEEWNAWKAAAPDGNVSGWLRALANAAIAEIVIRRPPSNDSSSSLAEREPAPPARDIRIHAPARDPEFIRREAELLASLNQEA